MSASRQIVPSSVAVVKLRDADRRAGLQDAEFCDQSGEASRGICAAAKSKNEYLIAVIVVLDKPFVRQSDVFVETFAEDATKKAVHTDCVRRSGRIRGRTMPSSAIRWCCCSPAGLG